MMKRTSLGVLVLEGLVGLHRTLQFHLLQHYWLDIDLDYYDNEWFAFEMNRDHFFFVCVWPNLYFIIFFFLKSIYLVIYFFYYNLEANYFTIL